MEHPLDHSWGSIRGIPPDNPQWRIATRVVFFFVLGVTHVRS